MSSEKPAYSLRHFISCCSNSSITQNKKLVNTLIVAVPSHTAQLLLFRAFILREQGTIHSRQASAWPCKTVDELGIFFLV